MHPCHIREVTDIGTVSSSDRLYCSATESVAKYMGHTASMHTYTPCTCVYHTCKYIGHTAHGCSTGDDGIYSPAHMEQRTHMQAISAYL